MCRKYSFRHELKWLVFAALHKEAISGVTTLKNPISAGLLSNLPLVIDMEGIPDIRLRVEERSEPMRRFAIVVLQDNRHPIEILLYPEADQNRLAERIEEVESNIRQNISILRDPLLRII